jgi:hypothetical protein
MLVYKPAFPTLHDNSWLPVSQDFLSSLLRYCIPLAELLEAAWYINDVTHDAYRLQDHHFLRSSVAANRHSSCVMVHSQSHKKGTRSDEVSTSGTQTCQIHRMVDAYEIRRW